MRGSAHLDRAGLLNLISDYLSPRLILVQGEGGARVAHDESLNKDREVVQAVNKATSNRAALSLNTVSDTPCLRENLLTTERHRLYPAYRPPA